MATLRTINPEQVAGLIRTVGQAIGGVLVGKGLVAASDWDLYFGAALIVVPTIWGFWARKDSNLIRSAADVPAVKEISAPGTTVAQDPSYPKVKAY